jgi:F0F1-type ATP synthase epsilon subunit
MNPNNADSSVKADPNLAVLAAQPIKGARAPNMRVKVYSPYKIYFDDSQCQSISAKNKTGPFDILPRHHNFITLLDPCELVIHYNGGIQRIRISRGIMHVKADRVIVFLDV